MSIAAEAIIRDFGSLHWTHDTKIVLSPKVSNVKTVSYHGFFVKPADNESQRTVQYQFNDCLIMKSQFDKQLTLILRDQASCFKIYALMYKILQKLSEPETQEFLGIPAVSAKTKPAVFLPFSMMSNQGPLYLNTKVYTDPQTGQVKNVTGLYEVMADDTFKQLQFDQWYLMMPVQMALTADVIASCKTIYKFQKDGKLRFQFRWRIELIKLRKQSGHLSQEDYIKAYMN